MSDRYAVVSGSIRGYSWSYECITCPICSRQTVAPTSTVYRRIQNERVKIFCSWSCLKEFDRRRAESREKKLEQADIERGTKWQQSRTGIQYRIYYCSERLEETLSLRNCCKLGAKSREYQRLEDKVRRWKRNLEYAEKLLAEWEEQR